MPKIREKSSIHENADANITCDFRDGDISRSRSFISNTCTTGANERTNEHSHVDFLNVIVDEDNHVTCCLISSGNFFPQYRTMPYHTINGNAVLQKILKLVMSGKVIILNCLSQTHIILYI